MELRVYFFQDLFKMTQASTCVQLHTTQKIVYMWQQFKKTMADQLWINIAFCVLGVSVPASQQSELFKPDKASPLPTQVCNHSKWRLPVNMSNTCSDKQLKVYRQKS